MVAKNNDTAVESVAPLKSEDISKEKLTDPESASPKKVLPRKATAKKAISKKAAPRKKAVKKAAAKKAPRKKIAIKKNTPIAINANSKDTKALEINQQMSILEEHIDALSKKLNSTNRKIKKDVAALTESDLDITEKVSETYKQLGIIESDMNGLNGDSKIITLRLGKINERIVSFEKHAAEAVESYDTQTKVNVDFQANIDALISQSQILAKKVDSITRKLNKSIKDNTKFVTDLEVKIVSELESLANSSDEADATLDNKIVSTNREVDSHKAKILLMQSVDEALDKRATNLETTSEQLLLDSRQLKIYTRDLKTTTVKLTTDLESLVLKQQVHEESILNLENETTDISTNLHQFKRLESHHYSISVLLSALLFICVVAAAYFAQSYLETESAQDLTQSVELQQQFSEINSKLDAEQTASVAFDSDMANLQREMDKAKVALADVEGNIVTINDQMASVDGRIQYLAPMRNFGSDNTIHGTQWLEKLEPGKFSIQVAKVNNKQDLYLLAQRYSYYFTRDLGYFQSPDKSYNLVYGGDFSDLKDASAALRFMPRYMGFHRLTALSNQDLLVLVALNK